MLRSERPYVGFLINSDVEETNGTGEAFKTMQVGEGPDTQLYDPSSAVVTKCKDDELIIVVRYRKRA